MRTYTLESTQALIELARDLCYEQGHMLTDFCSIYGMEFFGGFGAAKGFNGYYDEPEEIVVIHAKNPGIGTIEIWGAETVGFVVSHWDPQMLSGKAVA